MNKRLSTKLRVMALAAFAGAFQYNDPIAAFSPTDDNDALARKPYRNLKPELTKTQKRLRARAKAAKKARRLQRKLAN